MVQTKEDEEFYKSESANLEAEVDRLKSIVEKHTKTIANFRISFKNLEKALIDLKERNRLR